MRKMITKIVSDKDNILGYIIDDIWIPENILWIYTSETKLKYSDTKKGLLLSNNNIKVNNKVFKNLLYNCSDSKFIYSLFNDNNIKVNDIILVVADEIKENCSSLWKIPLRDTEKYLFVSNNTTLGVVLIRGSILDESLYIMMLETFKKDKGWGTLCMNYLLHNKSVSGYAVINAVPFWKSLGADFEVNSYRFTILRRLYEKV